MSDFEKRFVIYKKHFTDNRAPECFKCCEKSELYDISEGEYFCEICLEEDLKRDMEGFNGLTDIYLKKELKEGKE